jgi:hypothetical protein
MVRLLLGALAAAVVLFAWGFVYWAALPFSFLVIRALPDAESLGQTLKGKIADDGLYFYAWPDPDLHARDPAAARTEADRRLKEGPRIQVYYRKDGMDETAQAMMFAQGFLHYVVASLIAGGLLRFAGLQRYLARVLLVAGIGLFAAIWFHHPWPWALFQAVYTVIGWLLAGLVLAAFIRPRPAKI